jgi:hypothetical protein
MRNGVKSELIRAREETWALNGGVGTAAVDARVQIFGVWCYPRPAQAQVHVITIQCPRQTFHVSLPFAYHTLLCLE